MSTEPEVNYEALSDYLMEVIKLAEKALGEGSFGKARAWLRDAIDATGNEPY